MRLFDVKLMRESESNGGGRGRKVAEKNEGFAGCGVCEMKKLGVGGFKKR